jgi:DNA-binding XRE family transcriptional regulator
MSNVVSGRQLRTARIYAGLSQAEFAKAVGIDERSLRYWELKADGLPALSSVVRKMIEDVLLQYGVVLISFPTTGVRRPAQV